MLAELGRVVKERGAAAANVVLPRWTIHDLRRTARTLMTRAAVEPDYAERALATFRRKNSRPRALVPMAVWPGNCEGERVRA